MRTFHIFKLKKQIFLSCAFYFYIIVTFLKNSYLTICPFFKAFLLGFFPFSLMLSACFLLVTYSHSLLLRNLLIHCLFAFSSPTHITSFLMTSLFITCLISRCLVTSLIHCLSPTYIIYSSLAYITYSSPSCVTCSLLTYVAYSSFTCVACLSIR
jgi:hypothetical protein